jgi:hypothetical protein
VAMGGARGGGMLIYEAKEVGHSVTGREFSCVQRYWSVRRFSCTRFIYSHVRDSENSATIERYAS